MSSIGKILHKKRVLVIHHICDFSDCDEALLQKPGQFGKCMISLLSEYGYEISKNTILDEKDNLKTGCVFFDQGSQIIFQLWPKMGFLSLNITLDIDSFPMKKFLNSVKAKVQASSVENKKILRGPSILGF
ncbi:S-adenosylmethionine decarboxylase [Candidatus Riflebacteria bacterium]